MDQNFSDGRLSDMSRTMIIGSGSLHDASQMEFSMPSLYSAISVHSSVKGTPQAIRAWLMSSRQASPVSHSALPANASPKTIPVICGLKLSKPFASFDRDMSFWRMSPDCSLKVTSDEFSETWPKSFLISEGAAYRLAPLERLTRGRASGLLPTPNSGDVPATAVKKLLPTPMANDAKNNAGPSRFNRKTLSLDAVAGGRLNPYWVEWLMGWPIGWTDLRPLDLDRFRQWWQQHGRY